MGKRLQRQQLKNTFLSTAKVKLTMIIKPIIQKTDTNYDSDDVRFEVDGEIRGFGFKPKKYDDEKLALVKCPMPECGRENYSLAVLDGVCVWCGFDANNPEKKP